MTSSVADVPPSSLGDGELIAALENIEARRRSDYAHELRIVAELDGRNVALDNGCSDVAALLRQVLRINPAAARRYVAHTRALIHSYSTTGAVIDPDLPDVAEALGQGAVDPEHVEVIRATVAKFPRPVSLEDRTKAEQILLAASREHEPAIITRLGREILQRLDQDGTPPDDAELARPRRSLDLCEYAGGRLRGSFDLDPETGVLLTNLLSPHTAPCEADDGPDPRSRAERQADGLAEILRLAAACPQGPTEAGEPVNIMVTIPLERLERELRHGLLEGVGAYSASQIRRMACDANIIPSVLGAKSELLDIARKSRIIPIQIRRALIARDTGCAFPGCWRKAKWCQGHHIISWLDHGETKLTNLVLLCSAHHKTIHHTEWQVRMNHARPEFIPPRWLDPEQKPRRNPLHQDE